jgi:hypothetical protein
VKHPDDAPEARHISEADTTTLRRVVDFIEGKASAAALNAHDRCALGRWYYEASQDAGAVSRHPRFQELGVVHMAFHLACEEALRQKQAGDIETARSVLAKAAGLVGQVGAALSAVLGAGG